MVEMSGSLLLRRQSSHSRRVKFNRMYDPYRPSTSNGNIEHELVNETILEDEASIPNPSQTISRPTIHWGPVVQGDVNGKEQINTDTEHFDALFARSNAFPPPPAGHPRCYSSCTPATAPFLLPASPPSQIYARSQPLLSSSPSIKHRQFQEVTVENNPHQSISLSPKTQQTAHAKRKHFSLTHTAQTFLQATNSQTEQLEPLARSCSYKRPQSMKKYRQKKQEKEQQQSLSTRKNSVLTISHPVSSNSSRKSVTGRVSTADLMATDEPQDHWSTSSGQRSERVGSLPLDQLQIPPDGDEEIYLVRQFHTTPKGFINRGDSVKRSFKRSGSTSRRSSFRANANVTTNDRTPSQEHDLNSSPSSTKEVRTSTHSLTNPSVINLNGIVDSHFLDNNPILSTISSQNQDDDDNEEGTEEGGEQVIERIQTEDGRVHDINVYQVYLVGMSGTGKYSLMRQFKTTEYRGIYDYSSSLDDDPDNTVSIMLDGVESRLHIINIDIDQIKSSVTGDAYVVVYSIADRQSFQTALQLIRNVRDNESNENSSATKRHIPIILVGNKSDLVRKRSVTKEAARHAALKHDCKFIETSAAINDKVDDLLAGTLKQIRINEHFRNEEKRRLTINNGSIDTNDSEAPILPRKSSTTPNGTHSKSVFSKFFSVFRKKPTKLPADVENLNACN